MVSTSMMLNRPRYPVMAHSGQPTALNSVVPAGMNRAARSGTGSVALPPGRRRRAAA